MNNKITKVQHYVPRMYLKNFAYKKTDKKRNKQSFVWAYDKQKDRLFSPDIRDICFENYLYEILKGELNIDTDGSDFAKTNDIESYFSSLENLFDKTLRKIIAIIENPVNRNSLICSTKEKKTLCEFAANLLLRNPYVYFALLLSYCNYYETQTPLVKKLEKDAEQHNYGDIRPAILCAIEDLILKKDHANSDFNIIINTLSSLNMYFLYTRNSQFITSSCPVQCLIKNSSKLQCAYLPLTPNIALMFHEDYREHRNRIVFIADSEVKARNRYYCADTHDKNRLLISKEKKTLEEIIQS